MKKTHFVIIVILFLMPFLFSYEISNTRKEKIASIIARFQEAGENLSDPDVRSAILKEVSKFYPLEPEAKANVLTREEISKIVREKVNMKFPDSYETLEKKAKEAAAARFKKANINDYVRVTYEKGNKSYTVEGYFFGYGAQKHSVDIGGNIIALFDLIPEDRAKFDDKYREYLTDQFIKNQIRSYYTRKNDYSQEVLNKVKEEIINYNESAGYIFFNGQWLSPKEVTIALMDSMASRGALAKVEPIPIEKEQKTALPMENLPLESSKTETPFSDADKDKLIASIRRKAEIEQQKIKARFAGIDADQGYLNAIWGMTHQEVNYLFDALVDKPPQGNLEVLTYERGPIKKVELHFFHDYFYKVVIDFRIADPHIMEKLYRKIVEAYGKTDDEKLAEQQEISTENTPPADTQATSNEPPATLDIPEEVTLTWTGTETIGKLYIKLTPDKKSYSTFILTKESPKIIEEVQARLEKERKAKIEEERKRIQQEYDSFKIK